MRILGIIFLLLLGFAGYGQTVRTVGLVYVASAPTHTPSTQGAWLAVDTTSGSWYEWERTTGVWRDAGYRVQLTNTTGVPSYTPSKARGRVAVNSGDSLYVYQGGSWDCINCVAAPDLTGYVEWADTVSTIATQNDLAAIDLTPYVQYSDSNTIYVTPDQLNDTISGLGFLGTGFTNGGGSGSVADETFVALLGQDVGLYFSDVFQNDYEIPGVGIKSGDIVFGVTNDGILRMFNQDDLVEYINAGPGNIYFSSGDGSLMNIAPSQIRIENNVFAQDNLNFEDLRINPPGIEYNSDYSATFSDRSLVDKGYVNSQGFLQQLDTFSISGTTISASLSGDGVPAKTLTVPSGITGGVADYLVQYTGATTQDTAGVIWTSTGRLGVGQASPTARFQVTGTSTTSSTTALLVENSAGTDALSVTDDGSTHVNGNLGIAGGSFIRQDGASAGGWRFNVNDIIFYNQSNNGIGIIKSSAAGGGGAFAWGTTTPDASAIVDMTSTTQGLLPPRGTTAQMNAIASPAEGLMFYDLTVHKLYVYDGTAWQACF